MHVTAIIAAGGAGRRLGSETPKQLLDLGGTSILGRSVAAFDRHPAVSQLILVVPPPLAADPSRLQISPTQHPLVVVAGGTRRQDSVANAFDRVERAADVVLVHDAARPFVSASVISRTIDAAARYGAAIAGIEARDTVKRVERHASGAVVLETIPRETIFLAQTPQGFRRDVLAAAVALGRRGIEATDEAALAERAGYQVHVVEGEPSNVKITTQEDLASARRHVDGGAASRVGVGYDLHRLVDGRPLVLGGVTIPSRRGALGHSDADVICHAATDAVLGAAGLGDIGRHFPDTDARWKDASSIAILRSAATMAVDRGFQIANLDVTVMLESPKIKEYVEAMRNGVAGALGVEPTCVSIKGKTNEGMDAVGRGEAIAAHAVALLRSR
jgi:2-C-methyl-D-erythritol 4-phosphate cytidylyltransferase / 2-C-methyl-D-erythritol 2,4-cyclodiphosphate synthase